MRDFADEELDVLQGRHLAHLASLRERGLLLANGPLTDQPDESWRGIGIYAVSREEALRLASEDPSVQAGRLEPVALTWNVPVGLISFGAR
jgi:uncharacterized protein